MPEPKTLLVLWPTGRCNLRCRYCYAADQSGDDMSLNTAVAAIDLIGDKPMTIQFAGGEPLLNVDLIAEICAYATARLHDVRFALQTNGTLIDDSVTDLIQQYRIAVGVSLDGRVAVNDYLRGDTAATVRGIRLLADCNLAINITAVVSNVNVNELNGLVDMALYLGNVNAIGLDLLRKSGRAAAANQGTGEVAPADSATLSYSLVELYHYLQAINAGQAGRPIAIREFEKARTALALAATTGELKPDQTDLIPTERQAYCYAALGRSFVVLPGGDCYPCGSLAGQEKYHMGNVHQSVQPLAIDCVRPAECASCEHRAYCPGGCPSRGLLSGGFDELDCVMRKTTYQLIKEEV